MKKMLQPAYLDNGTNLGYAAGLNLETYHGLDSVSHSGGGSEYVSHMMWLPAVNLAVVILSNASDADPKTLSEEVADLYVSGQYSASDDDNEGMDGNFIDLDIETKTQYEGIYRHPSGMKFRVSVENDNLMVIIPGMGTREMLAESETLFALAEMDQKLSFYSNRAGELQLHLHQDGHESVFFKTPIFSLESAQLPEYIG